MKAIRAFLLISTRTQSTAKQLIEKPLETSAWNVAIQAGVAPRFSLSLCKGHRIKLKISIRCVAIDNLLPRTSFCSLPVIFILCSITGFSSRSPLYSLVDSC